MESTEVQTDNLFPLRLPREGLTRRQTVAAGALAGVASAAAMGLALMIHFHAAGYTPTYPLKCIAAMWFSSFSWTTGSTLGLVGIVTHLAIGAAWGMVFAWAIHDPDSLGTALAEGLAFSVAVWAGTTFLILPWLNPVLFDRVAQRDAWWALSHLIFGVVLVTTPVFADLLRRSGTPLLEERRAA